MAALPVAQHPLAGMLHNPYNLGPNFNSRPGSNVPKIDLLRVDTELTPKNLHTLPEFAGRMAQEVVNSARYGSVWYFGEEGLPIKLWNYGKYVWERITLPIAALEPNPENGSIPMVNREVDMFKGDVERFAVRARFNLSEIGGATAEEQHISIIKLTSAQLQGCAQETLSALVMRTFVHVTDAVRENAARENLYFQPMSAPQWFQYLRKTHGAASRGDGGFATAISHVDDLRSTLFLPKISNLILHQSTAALLTLDNREFFLGGEQGMKRFDAGTAGLTSFRGKTVNLTDTFRTANLQQPQNVLAGTARTGEFYYGHDPALQNEALLGAGNWKNWHGVNIYSEEVDAFVTITPQQMLQHSLWFDAHGAPSEALQDLTDRMRGGHVHAHAHHGPNFPAWRGVHNGDFFDPVVREHRSGMDKTLRSEDPMITRYIDHAARGVIRTRHCAYIVDVLPQFLSVRNVVAAARAMILTFSTDFKTEAPQVYQDAAAERAARAAAERAAERAAAAGGGGGGGEGGGGGGSVVYSLLPMGAPFGVSAVRSGSIDTAIDINGTVHATRSADDQFMAATHKCLSSGGVLCQHQQTGAFLVIEKDAEPTEGFEAVKFDAASMQAVVLPLAVPRTASGSRSSAGAGGRASTTHDSEVDGAATGAPKAGGGSAKGKGAKAHATTVDSSAAIPSTTAAQIMTDARGDPAIGEPGSVFNIDNSSAAVSDSASRLAYWMFLLNSMGEPLEVIGAARRWLSMPIATRQDHMYLLANGYPYPFRFMLVRDQITRTMASAVAYKKNPGNTLLSEIQSVNSMDSSDLHGYVSFQFNAGAVITDPKNVQILRDVAYLSYHGGKGTSFCSASEFNEWRDEPHDDAQRSDILVISQGANTPDDAMEYCSLTGQFDFRGYPVQRVNKNNTGTYVGLPLTTIALGLAQLEQDRQPREEYTTAEPVNINLCRGTARSPEDHHDIWSSGSASLDGGDYIGVRAVRLGERFSHASTQSLLQAKYAVGK